MSKSAIAKAERGPVGAPIRGKMKTELFSHEVSRVARTLGRDAKVEVVFAGDEAKTEGGKIMLPALPQGATIDPDKARGLRGYADHETFHVRKTDPHAWDKFCGRGKEPNEVWKNMAKAIEDMRVERYGLEDYPGAQKNISALIDRQRVHINKALEEDPAAASDKNRAGALALTLEGRRQMGTNAEAVEDMLGKLDPKIAERAKVWTEAVKRLPDGQEGTEQAIRLAAAIVKDMSTTDKATADELCAAAGVGGAGGGGEGEGEEGKGSGQNGGWGDDQEYDPKRFDGPGGGKGAGSGVAGGWDGDPEELASDIEALRLTKSPGLEAALASLASDSIDELRKEAHKELGMEPYLVMDPENDVWHTKTSGTYYTKTLKSAQGVRGFEVSTAGTAAQVSVMRRKLERMILAQRRRDWDIAREDGFLDPKRLTSAAMGNRNVHRVRIDRAELDTAVLILIDLSGSMSGGKAHLAQNVAIALAQCLTTIGADYMVCGFSNTYGRNGEGRGPSIRRASTGTPGRLGWGRVEPLDMVEFKGFNESLRDARSSLGSIAGCVGGNNSDADALYEAWNQLRLRNAKRRVMITLSDGSPAWYSNFDKEKLTRLAVKNIMAQGCDMAGVGILDASVKEFYPVWSVARSLDEFAGKTMDTLAKMLLGERVRVSA